MRFTRIRFVFHHHIFARNESRLFTSLPHRLRPYDISTVPSRFGRQPGVSIENMVDTRWGALIRKPHGATRGLYAAITSLSVEYMIRHALTPAATKANDHIPLRHAPNPQKGALIDLTFFD